jgi:NAD(P)H dehydrogenase (quinone)
MTREARVAVIYYSATGNVHRLAHAVADGAEAEGAEVRVRHVEELASELLISQNQHWGRHRSEVEDEPVATLDDLEWADGVAFGTPTRFGNVAAQLKQFMDQAGRLWQEGKLADRVGTAFTSSMTTHGGQESTILALNNTLYHWGMLILPLGYTASEVFNAGGNPYGTSYTSGKEVRGLMHGRRRSPATRGSASLATPQSSQRPEWATRSASLDRGRSSSTPQHSGAIPGTDGRDLIDDELGRRARSRGEERGDARCGAALARMDDNVPNRRRAGRSRASLDGACNGLTRVVRTSSRVPPA